jgi:hypothetical protein
MRARITFLAGFAVGFVVGSRAGRERYEQMVKLGRKAVENPGVQQATRAAGAKAAELSKTAGQKAAERMPKIAETAKSSASKVRDRIPGRNSGDDGSTAANGTRPDDQPAAEG